MVFVEWISWNIRWEKNLKASAENQEEGAETVEKLQPNSSFDAEEKITARKIN